MLWAYPSKVFTPIHMNHTNEAKLAELVLTELSCGLLNSSVGIYCIYQDKCPGKGSVSTSC